MNPKTPRSNVRRCILVASAGLIITVLLLAQTALADLPPRPECAQLWRVSLLDCLPNIELTLLVGQYAQQYHLPERGRTVRDTVRRWKDYGPRYFPAPHPSPRNQLWLKRNPWFEAEAIPELRRRIKKILKGKTPAGQ